MSRTDFNDLVHQLNRKLYGYAFRILRNQEEAEDAVQEVFIKLWKMNEKLSEYNSIDALATTMTKNYCIDQIRKLKHFHQEEFNGQVNLSAPSPHEQMENRESGDILNTIIDNMPEQSAELVKLREIDGLSYEEISSQTGINVNSIRVTISRARKYIRDEYNKHQYEQGGVKQFTREVL
jgi:RNA polymerase sigma factor (sigma-70 family)